MSHLTEDAIVQFVVNNHVQSFISMTHFFTPDKAFLEAFPHAIKDSLFGGVEITEDQYGVTHTAYIEYANLGITLVVVMYRNYHDALEDTITVTGTWSVGGESFKSVNRIEKFSPIPDDEW